MADLIRLRTSPQKWLLRKTLSALYPNRLLKKSYMNFRQAELIRLQKDIVLARSLITNYISKITSDAMAASSRSERNCRAATAAHALALGLRIQLAASSEAIAIETIANKIYSKITHDESIKTIKNVKLKQTTKNVSNLCKLSIALPSDGCHRQAMRDLIHSHGLLQQLKMIDHGDKNGAFISINALGESFSIGFHEADAERVIVHALALSD